jgi:hypothetical protein
MKVKVIRGFFYPVGKLNMPAKLADGLLDPKKPLILDVPPAVAKELVAMQKAEFIEVSEDDASGPMTTKSAKALVA